VELWAAEKPWSKQVNRAVCRVDHAAALPR
jgi:hypothetical protein